MIETVYRVRCATCTQVLGWFKDVPGSMPVIRKFTTVWDSPEEARRAARDALWTDLTCSDCRKAKTTTPQEET